MYWLCRYSFLLVFIMSKKRERLRSELSIRISNHKPFWHIQTQKVRVTSESIKYLTEPVFIDPPRFFGHCTASGLYSNLRFLYKCLIHLEAFIKLSWVSSILGLILVTKKFPLAVLNWPFKNRLVCLANIGFLWQDY